MLYLSARVPQTRYFHYGFVSDIKARFLRKMEQINTLRGDVLAQLTRRNREAFFFEFVK